MIGPFGIFNFNRDETADPRNMAQRLPKHLNVHVTPARGNSIGYATHGGTCLSVKTSEESGITVIVCGWISNCKDFSIPGIRNPVAADIIMFLICKGDTTRFSKINGQFCAAAYDKNKHRLFLITDRNGTFPLYVWNDSNGVVFASQLYAFTGLSRIPKKVDQRVVTELFTLQRTIGDKTPLYGVKALPASCFFSSESGSVSQATYWTLEWKPNRFSKEDCVELIAETIGKAVKRQVEISDNTGLLLSGGLDSRLILAAATKGVLSCWTTASYEANPELTLARKIATLFEADHHPCVTSPEGTFDVLDTTVVACGGLYPASTAVSLFLPLIDKSITTLLTGHGLDYTFRGYYLPSRFIKIVNSKTRLPILKPIPTNPTGEDVLQNLRQGPPKDVLDKIKVKGREDYWEPAIAKTLNDCLSPWLLSKEPYNAWDAFILGNVSKHYAFTSMMSVRDRTNLANPAFDNEVFDVYLGMPPSWRCEGRLAQRAMQKLSSAGAKISNANTHFAADLHPWLEVAGLMGRGVLRRLKILDRPQLPSQTHSQGSWQNFGALMQEEPRLRLRLKEIQGRLDAVCFNVLDRDALCKCIDEHLEGHVSHTKLLRQLLTHDSWISSFEISGHD